MYEYLAKVLKIVDGDTIHLEIDLGLETFRRIKCRLAGINAPEMNTEAGPLAKEFLAKCIPVGTTVRIETIKDRTEKYGRYLVFVSDINTTGPTINEVMLQRGYAVPY